MDRLRYLLGVIPLAGMILGGCFLYSLLNIDDPKGAHRVVISFQDARGLKAGADVVAIVKRV